MGCIYHWYEPRLHAIKLGSTEGDSDTRKISYEREYEIAGEKLQTIWLSDWLKIRAIEQACHDRLVSYGCARVPPSKELFYLGPCDYDFLVQKIAKWIDDILEIVKGEIEDCQCHVLSDLINPKTT